MTRLGAAMMWVALSACSSGDGTSVPSATLSSPAARARGQALYRAHCSLCHGEAADGRGPRRQGLSTLPANFRSDAWRRRARPARVFEAIRDGVRGTPMPAWPALSEAETWDLVAYVLSVAEEGP